MAPQPQQHGAQPPFGGPPSNYGGPPFGQPPRKKRWPLFVGLALALVMVIGVAVTGWLYFSGRFGIGPLSAADKDAVSTIADGIEAPDWADDDQVECAADELVHESRSDELAKRGLIERDGDGDGDDWTYTGEWEVADATSYFDKLLDCDDDWADTIAKTWDLKDTDCLEDIGTETLGAYFANDLLTLADKDDDDSAEKGHEKTVKELDACYVKEPKAPSATATPGYRAVSFTFAEADTSDVRPAKVAINTGGTGSWSPLSGPRVEIETSEGGKRGCVDAQTVATYPWGTTKEAEQQFCGVAKPKRIFWKKVKGCKIGAGCKRWELNYEGFEDRATITAHYTSNGGDCLSSRGVCSYTTKVDYGGRGWVQTWDIPASYNGKFVARIGKLKVRIPG